jgi:hypothetical protein
VGRIVGRVSLSAIERGPAQSAHPEDHSPLISDVRQQGQARNLTTCPPRTKFGTDMVR